MDDWEQEFPVVDSFRNAAGQRIDFNISVIQTPSGYTVKAEETEESKCDRFGYQFESFATDSPFTALWDLRGKIKKELSIKYVDDHGEHLSLTHDEIEGRICYSKEDDSIVIPIFNSIKVIQQVNYKVTRLQKCFGTTNQPF